MKVVKTMLKMYVTMQTLFIAGVDRLQGDREKGATAVEYGLMVFLIAIVIIGAVTALGGQLKVIFNDVVTAIGGTPAP